MRLVKYGCIFVSAGVVITGALLWDGGNRRALSESEAELLAAAVERRQVAYGFWAQEPDFWTNNVVGPRKDWGVIYGRTMAEARDMVTNNSLLVLWIDAGVELADRDVIARSGATYKIVPDGSDYQVQWSGATNASALVHSTGSHVADERYLIMPDVSTNDVLPVADRFFGSGSRAPGAEIFGGTNNWWTAIGLGTNLYKYGCEEWRGIDGDQVAVSWIGGAGFSNNVDFIEIPYPGGSKAGLKFISTSESTNLLLAAVYKLSAEGRDDAFVVVSDGASGISPGIVFSQRTVTVAEGGTVSLGIRPASNSGGMEYIEWDVLGEGVAVSGDYFFWGGNNPPWSSMRYFDVIGLTDSNPTDAAAVIRFKRSSQPAYHYVAVRVVDPDAATANLSADPVLSSVSKGGEVSVSVAVTAATNVYMVTSPRVVTNNLMEAKAALQSLRRSMVVLDAAAMGYSNRVSICYAHNHSDQAYVSKAVTFTDALAYHNAGPYFNDVTTNSVGYDAGDLARIEASIWVNDDDSFVPSSKYFYGHDYIIHQLAGCSVGYPSDYAFASNYVSRVRIYLCLAATLCQRYGVNDPDYWDGDPDLISGSLHGNPPWFYEDYDYGVWAGMLSSRYDGSAVVPPDQIGHPKYRLGASGFAGYKLVQVVDEAQPHVRPVFDLGAPIGDYNLALSGKCDFQAQEISYTMGDDSVYYNGFFDHVNEITIERIVVIVDWDWQHLGDAE